MVWFAGETQFSAPTRRRAHVLGSHPDRLPGADAGSDEREQRFDKTGDRNVIAKLAVVSAALDQGRQRCSEAGLGRAALAQEHDEVRAHGDQRAGRAGERLLDRNLIEVRLCETAACLLVCGGFGRPQSVSRVGK